MKMDQNIKKQWVEALRSGEYKQGVGLLRDYDNNFCCLGVLCNLHAQAHPKIAAKQPAGSYLKERGELPEQVRVWAKLPPSFDGTGWISELPFSVRATKRSRRTFSKGYQTNLAQLNDEGCNFKQIADVIEAVL